MVWRQRGMTGMFQYIRVSTARLMLGMLEKHTPRLAAGLQLQLLMRATAAAFQRKGKMIWHLPPEKALRAYAEFTTACMRQERLVQNAADGHPRGAAGGYPCGTAGVHQCGRTVSQPHTSGETRRRLYREAYRLGSLLRRLTGFTESRDLQRLVFYLYRNIGISMSGYLPGEVTVTECYFSRLYTPEQCALMSCMDWGVIAGICGGGKLAFTARITEGCAACSARLTCRQKENCRGGNM